MVPSDMSAMPHQAGPGAASAKTTTHRPYKATFSIAPDRRADALGGATGCARGNQKCSGSRPAFEPKPIRERTKAPARTGAGRLAEARAIAAKDASPAWAPRQ